MKVTQDEIVDRQATLKIEVDADELEVHLNKAYGQLVGRVNVPGFRRGKAPRTIFERTYGHERLVEDALETLVPDIVQKAIEQEDIEAGGTPRVNVLEREPEPRIEATVPLTPLCELGDYSLLSMDEKPEDVDEESVDTTLERIREGHATWEPKEGAAENGDMAVLGSTTATAAGKEVFSSEEVEYVITPEATYPVPGYATEIIGLSAGDEKEFALILPDDYPDGEVAGQTAEIKVTVSEVKFKVVPELDDEFAKGVSDGFPTLEDFRNSIRDDLQAERDHAFNRELEDRALDEVVGLSSIEIPPLTIEHESEHVLEEQQQALSRYNMSLQDYMKGLGKTTDDLLEEARETARMRLTRALVIEKVSEAEDIEVDAKDVREEVNKLKENVETPDERAAYETDQTHEQVSTVLRRRKALARLLEIATQDGTPVKAVDETDEAEDAGSAVTEASAPEDETPPEKKKSRKKSSKADNS